MLDSLGVFETFGSPWFSAIYLLLFISLVGCVVPRTKHHFDALRARPPKTPARLQRLVGFTSGHDGRRMRRPPSPRRARCCGARATAPSCMATRVSAERGYLRETGNLIFHSALVGILVTVGVGGGFGYTGQKVIVQDELVHERAHRLRLVQPGPLLRRDASSSRTRCASTSSPASTSSTSSNGKTQPLDFTAELSTRTQDGDWEPATLKVNSPLEIGGTEVYLLGNGYAPVITVRDPDGVPVYSGAIPFLPQDANLTSLGVVKVPDGLAEQLGIIGFFYPDPVQLDDGRLRLARRRTRATTASLTLTVYQGDLGLDTGAPVNVYSLDTDELEQIAGRDADVARARAHRRARPSTCRTASASIEFTGLQRFVSVDIHHDPTPGLGARVRADLDHRPAGEPVHPAPPGVGEGGPGWRTASASNTPASPAARTRRWPPRSPSSRSATGRRSARTRSEPSARAPNVG